MQRLKRTIQGLRVVLLSSNDQREAAVNALASGAFDCVMKPLRISELERVVEEAVEHTDETVRIAETANTEDTVVMTRDEYVEMAKD
jgi:DNA-binding NtrC family response regulator